MTKTLLIASAVAVCAGVGAQEINFQPAIYRTGSLPTLPVTAVGGGEVLLDAAVDTRGAVTAVTELRVTPPFGDLFAEAVRGWLFRPARDLDALVPSHVLVALLVRPPALTVPSTFGEPPRDLAVPRPDIPVPIAVVTPVQPPHALRSGVVLLEARIDSGGRVMRLHVLRSAAPFDGAAQDAAWQWKFRAARVRGTPIASIAYLAFGFPEIVTGN